MSKRNFYDWKLCVVVGVVIILVGIRIPFVSEPQSFYERVLMTVSCIGCVTVGIMQFRLAQILYRRAQKR